MHMAVARSPDVIVHLCHNCVPQGVRLPRQWQQEGAHVLVREVPCTGKVDAQYLFHALEGGARGVCVVACPHGDCRLAQGNYRAEVRVATVQRLLAEIGLDAARVQLVHNSPSDPPERLKQLIDEAVEQICAQGESPLSAISCQPSAISKSERTRT
jgi:F420-non-reducing hydrogenase iron-sulfur subunit